MVGILFELTHFCLKVSSSLTLSTSPFPIKGESGNLFFFFLLLLSYIEIHVFNANRLDPDQTPHSGV